MEMVHFIPTSQRRLALLAAQADHAPVLILGASGTGKSAIAKWIHRNGPRSTLPFISTRSDLPLVSQIIQAQAGSVFINEIGSLSLSDQKTLLQFLVTRSLPHPQRPGISLLVHARVMASSSQALEKRAEAGMFNQELLQRLKLYCLEMPPLEKRKGEFEDIALGIIGEISRDIHKEHLRELSGAAWSRLKDYDWPGNLRELRNVLKIAVSKAAGDRIEEWDLPQFGHERLDFHATREAFEKTYLTELLKSHQWQIDQTCMDSEIEKSVLMEKIEKYGIQLDRT